MQAVFMCCRRKSQQCAAMKYSDGMKDTLLTPEQGFCWYSYPPQHLFTLEAVSVTRCRDRALYIFMSSLLFGMASLSLFFCLFVFLLQGPQKTCVPICSGQCSTITTLIILCWPGIADRKAASDYT